MTRCSPCLNEPLDNSIYLKISLSAVKETYLVITVSVNKT